MKGWCSFFCGRFCRVCFRFVRLGFFCLVLWCCWSWRFFFCFGCASSSCWLLSCWGSAVVVAVGCVSALFASASGGSCFCPCLGVVCCRLSFVSVVCLRSFRWRFLPCPLLFSLLSVPSLVPLSLRAVALGLSVRPLARFRVLLCPLLFSLLSVPSLVKYIKQLTLHNNNNNMKKVYFKSLYKMLEYFLYNIYNVYYESSKR